MKKARTKFLSLLLVLCMVISMIPVAVFAADNEVSGTGNLVGGTVYTLDTDGTISTTNPYLIVNTSSNGTGYALNTSSTGSTGSSDTVTIADQKITTNSATEWTFNGMSSATVQSGTYYVYLGSSNCVRNNTSRELTTTSVGSGEYQIYYTSTSSSGGNRPGQSETTTVYYLRYSNGWSRTNTASSVYLYEKTGTTEGAAVEFAVTPGSVTLAPEATQTLTGTVTVGGQTVDLSNCTIAWASSAEGVATVSSNGTVTAVADGTANITATLTAVDGKTVANGGITLTIPVTVQNKAVTNVTLSGSPLTVNAGKQVDWSKLTLTVTYDDGSTEELDGSKLTDVPDVDTSMPGTQTVQVSYSGYTFNVVINTVISYEGLTDATTYPAYPADGAVRIDKTATEKDFDTTGVVEVELDVAGVSVKSAVDVILVTDLSNSMAWAAGSRTDATSHEDTKMYDLQQSVASFADIFLAADEDGTATKNTMSLVTFGGYDADYTTTQVSGYADTTQTLLLGTSSATEVKNTVNNIRLVANSVAGTSYTSGYALSFNGGDSYGENYGNTNYDHAFMQTSAAIADLKAAYKTANGTEYDDSGRQIYILFMTDGAPSNYDGVYYNYKTGDRADVYCQWINESGETTTYTMGNNRAQYGEDAWFQYIAGGAYDTATGTIPGNPLYWADQVYNTASVATIYSIGFDIDNGGFSSMTFTEADGRPLSKVLEHLVTGQTLEVYSADDQAGLAEIYSDLANKIRYAGTAAQADDIIDSDFTLQMGSVNSGTNGDVTLSNYGITPSITIRTYDLYTKDETTDTTLIGTRKGTYSDIEVVTFNAAGTAAYSTLVDVDGDGTYGAVKNDDGTYSIADDGDNIMSTSNDTVTINAKYFTYTKTAAGVESFKWIIGNITDKEIALIYYAYLTGSLEGARAKGLYYTNEEATLEYIDINGYHATQTFPVPAVAWGGASTAYEFYLVNENGEPCDRDGNVIPFANRVIITGPYYEELYLNQEDEEQAKEIIAAYVLPAGYTLYDDTAKYTVITASGTMEGSLVISEPASDKAQTTVVVSATTPSYIQSHVAFGVMYNEIPDETDFELPPDQVVIDYGKPITIDITSNGIVDLEAGYTATLVGFSKYYDTVALNKKFTSTSAINNYQATYGIFSIESDGSDENGNTDKSVVRYTPTAIVNGVEDIFCVIKMYNAEKNDTYYMVDHLTVIPATNVYYETDFASGVFSMTTSGAAWSQVDDPVSGETENDNEQDGGIIGKGQTYGYDSSYTDDAYFSDGDSWFVEGQGYDTANNNAPKTYTTFSFKGTGFELYSRTGAAQGLIKVEVVNSNGIAVKTVSVLNKSDSSLELYQIPVVSVNGLDYDTYTVTVSVDAAYTAPSEMPALSALNRGNEFYFDAIRVYEPALGDEVAENAYYTDGESKPNIREVREALLEAGTFDAIEEGDEEEGMVFIDKTQDGAVIATYATIGPNNEVYLSNGQAIAFEIDVGSIPASFDIGAKAITGTAADLKVTVTNGDDIAWTVNKTITSSSAQFIDLMTDDADTDVFGDEGSEVYVIITNPDTDTDEDKGVLSITDIKVAWGGTVAAAFALDLASDEEAYDPYAVSYTVDAATFAVARSVLAASEEVPEETEPEATEPEVTEPEVTEPEVTEPEVTEPEVTEPEATEPEVTEPEATEPEATEPENNYSEVVTAIINKIVNDLTNLLNKWFK